MLRLLLRLRDTVRSAGTPANEIRPVVDQILEVFSQRETQIEERFQINAIPAARTVRERQTGATEISGHGWPRRIRYGSVT